MSSLRLYIRCREDDDDNDNNDDNDNKHNIYNDSSVSPQCPRCECQVSPLSPSKLLQCRVSLVPSAAELHLNWSLATEYHHSSISPFSGKIITSQPKDPTRTM